MNRSHLSRFYLFALILLAMLPVSIFAESLISESFPAATFTVGDLNGQNGWSGSSSIEVDATGLDHAGMNGESGRSIRGLTAFTNVGAGVVSATTGGTDSALSTSTSYWFAALLSMTDNSGTDYNYVRMSFDSSGGNDFTFGLLDNQFVVNGSASGFSGAQYSSGTSALVVGRMTVTGTGNSTDEVFDFWFNPTDATDTATLGSTAQGTILSKQIGVINGDWGAVTIQADMAGSNLNTWYQDEIRVATSLAELNLAGAGLSPAQEWRQLYFETSENSGDADNFNDFDDDSLLNIVERAFGHDPKVQDPNISLGIGTGDINGDPLPEGAYWHFSYPRISGGSHSGTLYTAEQIVYEVEWSDDLITWQPDNVVEVSSGTPDVNGIATATVRLEQAISSADRIFFRLRIAPVVPAAPDELASLSVSYNAVFLTWSDNADDESSYIIEVSTDGVNFTALAPLPADSTSYNVSGLSPETDYTFRMHATGIEGDSSSTAELVATTTAIPILNGLLPFHIGNSLTQMREIPQQVSAFALAAGYADHASIQSTISGHFLWEHWQGIGGSTAPDNIANGVYDTLILQGNSAEWEPGRIGTYRSNAQNFHNLGVANRNAQTWIYSYWQGSGEPRQWQRYVSDAFEGVRPQLTGGKWTRIIPVGDAVEYFLQARDDGRITGIPREDFYSDTIHPSTTGGYFISLVHYAAMYGTSPIGLPANNGVAGVSAPLATEMQTMIWEFLQTYPFAGVYAGMPAVDFTADVYSGLAPLTVNFDASASDVPDASETISSIAWEILKEGETTPTTHSGLTLNQTLTDPGIYHVSAVATSSNGRNSAPLTQAIRVSAPLATNAIGINFNTDQGGTVAASEYAGIVPQQNWNNYAGKTSGSIASLKDHAGNNSGSMSLTSNSGYRSQDSLSFNNPDFKMLSGNVRSDSTSPVVIAISGLPTAFTTNGYKVIVYCNSFPSASGYPDNREIAVDWGNDSSVDQTLTGLAQWSMPEYDQTRPDYDYTDASGAAQFYHEITIPAGHTAFSLTLPSTSTFFAVSGIQIVALP